MPTGTALQEPRESLLAAGQRVLATGGVGALTSRAVTDEAGVAKGVLHRYFASFDDFQAELVRQQLAVIAGAGLRLITPPSSRDAVAALRIFFLTVLDPTGLRLIGLVMARDEVRHRVRSSDQRGMPVLREITEAVRAYLEHEQRIGRIRREVNIGSLALALVGTAHLLFAGELGATPDDEAVDEVLGAALVGTIR